MMWGGVAFDRGGLNDGGDLGCWICGHDVGINSGRWDTQLEWTVGPSYLE